MTCPEPVRMTKQRRVILEELRKLKTHPTAKELYELVRERIKRISLGTVYRNLELLSGAGIIQKLEVSGTERRFDGMVENHYHIRCVRCGRVGDVPAEPIPAIEDAARSVTGYQVMTHRLEFLGLCDACAAELKPSGRGDS
jgi:Fe2+ or Zn2+ uptake regulation protein